MPSWMRRGCRTAAWVTVGAMPIAPAHSTALGMQTTAGSLAAVTPIDGEWPRRYVGADRAVVVVHEPRVASWSQQRLLSRYAAVSGDSWRTYENGSSSGPGRPVGASGGARDRAVQAHPHAVTPGQRGDRRR